VSPSAVRLGDTPIPAWEHWNVQRSPAPPVDMYTSHDRVRRPLVLMLQGSHCVPLFWQRTDKSGKQVTRSSLAFEEVVEERARTVHFAAIERRHIKSFVPESDINDKCSETHGGVSKEDRARDAADAVRALHTLDWVGPILLIGHSEGADVAASAARLLGDGPPLSVIGIFASGGPSQFFDNVMEARRTGDKASVQNAFDELLSVTGPTPPATYSGFPVERFLSYAVRSTPLDDLRSMHTPVFIAQGTRDHNSAVESADLLAVELLRTDPRRPVKYLILNGLDHGYFTADEVDHKREVFEAFLDWSLGEAKPRGVESRSFVAIAGNEPRVRYLRVDVRIWKIVGATAFALVGAWLVVRFVRRRRTGQ
jgi:pimeloyl-ACP methyl ester carboxylesterase